MKKTHTLFMNSAELAAGDYTSISVLFGNLSGKNFNNRIGHDQTHSQWLRYTSKIFATELPIGAPILVRNAKGTVLHRSEIGKEVTALNPPSSLSSDGNSG